MNSVIWISLVGAGLVILGLVLLWFMMDILVRLTASKKTKTGSAKLGADPENSGETELLQKAAAASTAVAIALSKATFLSVQAAVDHNLTAWQNTHRHSQLHNKPLQPKPSRKN